MAAKNGAEKEKKQGEHQQSLKGALAEVLTRNGQPTANSQQPMQTKQTGKSAAAEPPREQPPTPSTPKPYEVPEDALRKVFKGDT